MRQQLYKRKHDVPEDSDQWEEGIIFQSDPDEATETDEKLFHHLESNTSFLLNMTKTGAFTAPFC